MCVKGFDFLFEILGMVHIVALYSFLFPCISISFSLSFHLSVPANTVILSYLSLYFTFCTSFSSFLLNSYSCRARKQKENVCECFILPALLHPDLLIDFMHHTDTDLLHYCLPQGVKQNDHFGFICREISGDTPCYLGYVFKCQMSSVTDEIMQG